MVKTKVEEITIKASDPNLHTAFGKLATEMFKIVTNVEDIDLKITKTIIIRARDSNNLLFQFMKRLYDLANNELFLLSTIKQITVDKVGNEYLLDAVLIGDKLSNEHVIKDIVKQVTDRNIIVKEERGIASVQINLVVERRNLPEEEAENEV
jgi:SHS2 domain-containing protein